jgi:hypothetical protein
MTRAYAIAFAALGLLAVVAVAYTIYMLLCR